MAVDFSPSLHLRAKSTSGARKVQEHLKENFPEVTEVSSAVIWFKACSVMKPDYYVDFLEDSPWIHQPFEVYDDMTPDKLPKG